MGGRLNVLDNPYVIAMYEQKQAEVIAELIKLGMSWKYCELKVSQLYVFVTDCIRVKLLYESEVKACYEIIQEATIERQ